jgi:hypothetical protein
MKSSHWASLLSLSSACFLAACVADTDDNAPSESAEGSRFHMMPLRTDKATSDAANAAPAGAHLTYFGGPVLTQTRVIPIFWNANVAFQANLNAFYAAVPNSPLYDMLRQYSGILRGSKGTSFTDNRGTGSFTDAAIQARLNALFTAGSIPAPAANNYYPIHFPAGVSITASDGSQSCVQFCAYHGTYKRNNINVNYGIIPDQGGGCAGGCGRNASRVNNLDSVASHELVEATTDPAVGLATVFGPPLAWYDRTFGEIGDICNGQQGTVVGGDGVTYVVQTEFSNAVNNCVTR